MRNRKNQFIVFSLEFLTLSSNQHFSSLFYYSGFALFMGLDKHTGRQIRQIRQAHRQTDQTDIQVDKLDVRNRQTHRYTDQKYQTDAQVYRLDTFDIPIRQTDKYENQTDQTTTEVDRLDILEKYTAQTTIQIKQIHRQTAKQIREIQTEERIRIYSRNLKFYLPKLVLVFTMWLAALTMEVTQEVNQVRENSIWLDRSH